MPLTTYTAGEVLTAASLNANFTFAAANPSSGLTLVATATPTAVSSVSINSCFTSTYENYRILFSLTAMTGSQGNLSMRLRAAGTDTITNYENQLTEFIGTTLSTGADPLGTDEWFVATLNSELAASFSMDIYRPQTAQKTVQNNAGVFMPGSTTVQQQLTVGVQKDSTQFDGFSLLYSGTTFTGTVRVYGYLNS